MMLEGEFRLGDWIVSPHTNTVVGPEGEARVEPKAMQVLAFLAQRAGRVVSKREILTDVWEGSFVSEEVLPNAIWELRKALRDDAKRPRFIQTLPKKGYRLIAPVTAAEERRSSSAEQEAPEPGRVRWKRIAAGAAAAVAAGAAALLWFARGAEIDRVSPDRASSILVLAFENDSGSEELAWLSTGIPTMLRTGLAEVPGVEVVSAEREDLGNAIPARELGRMAGADSLIRGSIFRVGSEYRIDVQVEDVKQGTIVSAHSVRGQDVFPLVDELTEWVRGTLNAGAAAEEPIQPLREMTTASLEAFRLYDEGVEARRHVRLSDARRLLSEAVLVDPSFALAYWELQRVSLWNNDFEAHDRYREKTLQYMDRLPPQKRALLEATEIWKEDRDRAERLLQELIDRQPGEEEAYMQLSHLYRKSYRSAESLRVMEKGVGAVPHSGYLRLHYGYALLWEGRYPEAIHQFETYARIHPEEANPWDSMGEAYIIAGIPERALERYARALEIDPEFTPSHLGRAWAFGLLGRYEQALAEIGSIRGELPPHLSPNDLTYFRAFLLSKMGRYREADGLLDSLEDVPALELSVVLMRSLFDLERGRSGDALARIEAVVPREKEGPEEKELRRPIEAFLRLVGGIAACREGDLSQAKRYLAELGEIHEPRDARERWWYHLLLGELALASGDARAAFAAFTQGEPEKKLFFNAMFLVENLGGSLPFRSGPARAKAIGGDAAAAIDIYRQLLRPDIGQKWTAVLEPRFHLELARLERDRGARPEAERRYREFLELWSKADSHLPEIAEAESYLTSS